MEVKVLNPSFKFLLLLIIALVISATNSVELNLIVIFACFIYLVKYRLKLSQFFKLLLYPALAAISVFITVGYFSKSSIYDATSLASRIYVYVFTGAALTLTTDMTTLARSFEQNLHLPAKFAYGFLAAVNILPKMKRKIRQIRYAGLMRQTPLSLFSPRLYFKALLAALANSEMLAQAMVSHGFSEDKKRSVLQVVQVRFSDYLWFGGILFIFSVLVIFSCFLSR